MALTLTEMALLAAGIAPDGGHSGEDGAARAWDRRLMALRLAWTALLALGNGG
jgi:hypothetical protein